MATEPLKAVLQILPTMRIMFAGNKKFDLTI